MIDKRFILTRSSSERPRGRKHFLSLTYTHTLIEPDRRNLIPLPRTHTHTLGQSIFMCILNDHIKEDNVALKQIVCQSKVVVLFAFKFCRPILVLIIHC